jgi:hypothetical protein
MNLKKIIGFAVIAMVIYYIVSNPIGAAGTGNNIINGAKNMGDSASQFVANMTAG